MLATRELRPKKINCDKQRSRLVGTYMNFDPRLSN